MKSPRPKHRKSHPGNEVPSHSADEAGLPAARIGHPIVTRGKLLSLALTRTLAAAVNAPGKKIEGGSRAVTPRICRCRHWHRCGHDQIGVRRRCLSITPHPGDQPVPRRQRVRHDRAHRGRSIVADSRTIDNRRATVRRGWRHRLPRSPRPIPDGYTLVTSSSSMANGKVLHSHLPYDALTDFVPIAMFGNSAERAGGIEAKRLQDGGRSRRSRQGEARNADFCLRRNRLHLAYGRRKIPPRRQNRCPSRAVPRGRSDRSHGRPHRFLFHSAGGRRLDAHSGKLSALAVSTPKRAPLLPDVPTVAEAGYPAAELNFWVGLSAPAKTPRTSSTSCTMRPKRRCRCRR